MEATRDPTTRLRLTQAQFAERVLGIHSKTLREKLAYVPLRDHEVDACLRVIDRAKASPDGVADFPADAPRPAGTPSKVARTRIARAGA
jgi:hypothetical protein